MNKIRYQMAHEKDIPALIALRLAFQIEYTGPQEEAPVKALTTELVNYFKRSLTDGSYLCWLAMAGEEAIGVGGMCLREQPGNFRNPSGKVGYIMNMYTMPAYRKKGIAGEILNRLIATAKKAGVEAFELHATKAGEPLYLKNGFHLHDEPTYRKY